MPLLTKIRLSLLVIILHLSYSSGAQSVYVNTADSIYRLTNVNGQCRTEAISPLCNLLAKTAIFSIGVYRDTIYYTDGSALFRVVPGQPSSCSFVTNLVDYSAGFNSLTIDKNGILYAINSNEGSLYSYDPYKKETTMLGYLPRPAGGDMIFYKNKLLYTTWDDGIYEIRLDETMLSKQYMSTNGYIFWGLLSLPFDCNRNKICGVSSSGLLTELDLENRQVLGIYCELNLSVYDAASNVDDGSTVGITIDSIKITNICSGAGADVAIQSTSASQGLHTYRLDNAISNTTGLFSKVSPGLHAIHISNQLGCEKDSLFTVTSGLHDIDSITSNPTINCFNNTGSVLVAAGKGYGAVSYSIDNGPFQAVGQFLGLPKGVHAITIMDAAGCRIDTSVAVGIINGATTSVPVITPAYCNGTGGIDIELAAGTVASAITTALENGPFSPALHYNALKPGKYRLSVIDLNSCRYDTLVEVKNIMDPAPAIQITEVAQRCFIDNGSVRVSLQGNDAPYRINFNKTGWQVNTDFQNLAPGTYPIAVTDKNGCTWDTIAAIKAYPVSPVTYVIKKVDPDCDILTNGQLKATLTGSGAPYSILLDNKEYGNDSWITNLVAKDYFLQFKNGDGCIVDSITTTLSYQVKSACDTVHVPNAFSPNGDGINDFIKPIATSLLKDVIFAVYNRYGQKLYESTGRTRGWDGKWSGRLQPAGAYVWAVQYKNASGQTRILRGTLLLMP